MNTWDKKIYRLPTLFTALSAYLVFSVSIPSLNATPTSIVYQGSLKQSGALVNGTYAMIFNITNIDGSQIYWTSGSLPVVVTQGLYRVELTPTGITWATIDPYIETRVSGNILLPREKLSNAPYALLAKDLGAGATANGDLQINGRTTAAKSDANTLLSSELGTVRLQNTSATPNNFAGISYLESNGNPVAYAGAQIGAHGAASGSVFGDYVIATKAWGVGGYPIQRIRADSRGNISLGYIDASQSVKVDVDNKNFYPAADQQWAMGRPGNQWTAVWAVNGTIQSSSSRLKKEIREISINDSGASLVSLDPSTITLPPFKKIVSVNGVQAIQPVPGQAETFDVPRGIVFQWKNALSSSTANTDMIGFMGDDLPVEAHAVRSDGTRDPENYQTSAVVGLLCAKVRALDAQNKSQAATINTLNARLSALENKVNK